MITAGVDCGAQSVKLVLLRDRAVLARSSSPNGEDQQAAATRCLDEVLSAAGLSRGELNSIAATGVGRRSLPWATVQLTDVTALALGAVFARPTARTILDVGAEEARAIRCDAAGRVLDFALNERCAAGTGAFVEAMSRALGVPLGEIGPLSLRGAATVTVNAQCAVFAESEVVSLIHARVALADIALAVHQAIAGRLASLAARVGVAPDVVVTGGFALSAGLPPTLAAALGVPVFTPDSPEYAGATGAALAAVQGAHQPS